VRERLADGSVGDKAFLLFGDTSTADWSRRLSESRKAYAESREHFLKFIKHPQALASLNVDPLADDPEVRFWKPQPCKEGGAMLCLHCHQSPWNSLREDEAMRAEIAQDVRRLPDEPFYHEPHVQTMIIDVLFIHCKLNPKAGGYRQGMHELLAPILYVVEADAVERGAGDVIADEEVVMVDMLDAAYVEHDAYALFSKVMERAGSFYEVTSEAGADVANGSSVIVEKSKYIHERCLMQTDPELASHLKSIEILPQIFLM
jgi:TBC1 domain family member 5